MINNESPPRTIWEIRKRNCPHFGRGGYDHAVERDETRREDERERKRDIINRTVQILMHKK
jgi:hypothetical protein